jgi:hypothetical protein
MLLKNNCLPKYGRTIEAKKLVYLFKIISNDLRMRNRIDRSKNRHLKRKNKFLQI